MKKLIKKIEEEKIIVILRGLQLDEAIKTADALEKAHIKFLEVTFNQKGDLEDTCQIIEKLIKEFPQLNIGAGTVMAKDQVKMAYDAGARYVISPNLNEKVIRLSKKLGMISIPGAMTPSEIVNAYECGADIVKIFPADQLGNSYIKSVCAPLNHIPIAAVGGIDLDNIREFFQAGVFCVGIGSNIVQKNCIKRNDYEAITELAKSYVQMIRG